MLGVSWAFPNRVYFVLDTLVFRPEILLNSSRMLRTFLSWASGSMYFMDRFISSAYASVNFWWSWAVVQGFISLELLSFRRSSSMQIMKR